MQNFENIAKGICEEYSVSSFWTRQGKYSLADRRRNRTKSIRQHCMPGSRFKKVTTMSTYESEVSAILRRVYSSLSPSNG